MKTVTLTYDFKLFMVKEGYMADHPCTHGATIQHFRECLFLHHQGLILWHTVLLLGNNCRIAKHMTAVIK
jgi:hypothetical protein